jgi:hypothetical protein
MMCPVRTRGATTVYVYDAFGKLAAEYASSPVQAPCTTCYLVWDQLGSTRLVTDQNGNVVARHDYLPFGEEIAGGTAGRNGPWGVFDNVNQKFTGQVRDSETGQDFFSARYFTGTLGRFKFQAVSCCFSGGIFIGSLIFRNETLITRHDVSRILSDRTSRLCAGVHRRSIQRRNGRSGE